MQLSTFEERIEYLRLSEVISENYLDRRIKQAFYASSEWKQVRRDVLRRDNYSDLGINEITGSVFIHHINPIDGMSVFTDDALDLENLITVSRETHEYIHKGITRTSRDPIERSPNDTNPWR